MIALEFNVTSGMSAAMQSAAAAMSAEQQRIALDAAGRGMDMVMRRHFINLDETRANTLSSNRSHFYGYGSQGVGGIAKSVNHRVESSSVTSFAFAPGIPGALTHKIIGGTVTRKNAKALTIPVHPDAYGRRAREIDGLRLVWPKGSPFGWLVQEGEKVYHAGEKTKTGGKKGLVKRTGPKGSPTGIDFTGTAASAQRREGAVFYMLFRSVKHNPDPSVKPDENEVKNAAGDALGNYVNRVAALMRRRGSR